MVLVWLSKKRKGKCIPDLAGLDWEELYAVTVSKREKERL